MKRLVIFFCVLLMACSHSVAPVVPIPPVLQGAENVSLVTTSWINFADAGAIKLFPDPAPIGWQFTFPQSQVNPLDSTDPYGILLGSAHYRLTLYSTPLKIGDSISMTAAITAAPDAVFNFNNGVNTCSGQAHATLILMRADTVDGITDVSLTSPTWQDPTYRWFSDVAGGNMTLQPGTSTLTVPLDPTRWIDVNGDLASSSSDLLTAFQNALMRIWYIGFGFGGGCFAAHGVNVTSLAAAVFNLTAFQVIHS